MADDIPFGSAWTPASFRLPRIADASDYNVPISPVLVNRNAFDFHADGHFIGYPDLTALMTSYNSGGPTDYITYMTKLWSYDIVPTARAFNTMYDILFEGCSSSGGSRQFPPSTRQMANTDYPDKGHAFVLPADQTGTGNLFSGDLSTFDFGAVFNDSKYFSHQFDNATDFLAQFTTSIGPFKVFNRPMVACIQGDLDLPPLNVECDGVIVATGKVKIAEVKSAPGRLTVVALGGNIEVVSAPGGKLEGVSLVAPNGTVTWSSPLILGGTLAAKTLNPTSIQNVGGEIRYDLRMDPTDPSANLKGVTVILGPKDGAPLKTL